MFDEIQKRYQDYINLFNELCSTGILRNNQYFGFYYIDNNNITPIKIDLSPTNRPRSVLVKFICCIDKRFNFIGPCVKKDTFQLASCDLVKGQFNLKTIKKG